MLLSLYIVNRAGTLVFQRNLDPTLPKLSSNEYLRVGSTFHSLHELAKQAAPIESGGILKLEANNFCLQCLQTLTGIKFVLIAEPGAPSLDRVLQRIYSALMQSPSPQSAVSSVVAKEAVHYDQRCSTARQKLSVTK